MHVPFRFASPSLLLIALAWPGTAHAAALAVPEQSAASVGLAASGVARSGAPSNVFDNPAGLTGVSGTAVEVGTLLVNPGHRYSGPDGSRDSDGRWFVVPHAYVAHGLESGWSFGFGVYAPFGLGTHWADDWQGRYTSTDAELRAVCINPGVAYRVNERLSLGGGIRYFSAEADIQKKVDAGLLLYGSLGDPSMVANTTYDSHFKLQGDGDAWGFDLGAQFAVNERIDLGLHIVSGVELDFDGTATFRHADATALIPVGGGLTAQDLLAAQMPASQGGSTSLNLPWIVQFGALVQLTERWDLSASVDYNAWSSYEDLTVHLNDGLPSSTIVSEKHWDDAFTIRAGATCQLTPAWLLRLGALYDTTPVPDATYDGQLPDGDRVVGSIGFGYQRGRFSVDLGYMYVFIEERTKTNLVGYQDANGDDVIDGSDQAILDTLAGGLYPVGQGSYDGDVHLLALTLGYQF